MRTHAKIAAFGLGLLVVFGAATGIGAAVGPVGSLASAESHGEPAPEEAAAEIPGGLLVAQDGYRLDLVQAQVPSAASAPVRLRILGPNGAPLTAYATEHGKQLHLIAVRRDLTGFQHVHPRLDASGTWSTTLDTSVPGDYRVFADFRPEGREDGLTLGSDLAVPGAFDPAPFPPESRRSTVDGYTVDLRGDLVPGTDAKLTLSVAKAGAPIRDLDPYLEAYGHLVALRNGDLAYLHVHPAGAPGDGATTAGPEIEFYAKVPSPGRYRLFLDFSHGGVVRTAEFTLAAAQPDGATTDPAAPPGPSVPSPEEPADGHGGHGG